MKNTTCVVFLIGILIHVPLHAQIDTVAVPSDLKTSTEGNLNAAISGVINADPTGAKLSNTVFKLEPYGCYILTGTITTPPHSRLFVVAPEPGTMQQTAPPQLVWTTNGGVTKTLSFDCYGDVTMKNVWILSATTGGAQTGSSIVIEDDTLANLSGKGEIAVFDGCIFDYQNIGNSGGAIEPACKHFRCRITNTYFRNLTDPHFRYYGRPVSWTYQTTTWHTDTIVFENCTIANCGYAYTQETPEYADFVSFNHCTFLNTMLFSLESGYWYWLSVTNSIFVNTYMYGDIISQRTFMSPGYGPYGGTLNIDSLSVSGMSFPFTESQRHILFANSNYFIENWLRSFMAHNQYSDSVGSADKPNPQPMMSEKTISFFNNKATWPYINKMDLYDSVDPGFILAPTNQDNIKTFLLGRWLTGTDIDWAYNPTSDVQQVWPMGEDLSYANATLKSAGMSGFPLGDLYHWWPLQYASWKTQKTTENQNILNMLGGNFNAALGAPVLVLPSANAQNQAFDTLVLKWRAVPLASGYEFQTSSSPSFSTLIAEDSTADTTCTIKSLQHFTKYYWRVRAYNNDGAGVFSTVDGFTTTGVMPSTPTLISPANNATNQPANTKLVCSKAIDAMWYHWQVFVDSTLSVVTVNDSTTDTTDIVGPLSAGTRYYWRVRGMNSLGAGGFTNADTFTVMAAPSVPVLAQSIQNADSVVLKWHPALLASGYECQCSLSRSFSTLVVTKDSTADSTFSVRPLQYARKYYWRVRAFNVGGLSAFSATDSFATAIAVPAAPQLVSPRSITNVGRRTVFVWRASPSAIQYHIQVAGDSMFTVVVRDTVDTDTTWTLSTSLAANIRYYWRVSAINISGEGSYSNYAYFTTGITDNINNEVSEIPKEFALLQNYPLGTGLMSGAVFGRIAGRAAARS